MHRTSFALFAVLLASAFLLAGCGDDGSPTELQSGVVDIDLLAESFSPSEVRIEAGSTIRWRNAGTVTHTITPDGHSEWADTTLTEEGETFEHTFDTPGDFDYHCVPHLANGMTGVIRVE